jgi:hypothetical protein
LAASLRYDAALLDDSITWEKVMKIRIRFVAIVLACLSTLALTACTIPLSPTLTLNLAANP